MAWIYIMRFSCWLMNTARPSVPPPPPLSPLPNLTVTSHNWCLRKVSVIKLFLAVCTSGWQLSARTVTGLQIAFSGLLSDSQAAQGVFCSHNTLALRGSCREATNCQLRKKKKNKNAESQVDWRWMVQNDRISKPSPQAHSKVAGRIKSHFGIPKTHSSKWCLGDTSVCACACMFC